MDFPKDQTDQLKRYCDRLSAVVDGQTTFLLMEGLRLPPGCTPAACDGLLCPTEREGYPSRLYLSVRVASPYDRNWNVENARIAERNWFAFSWKVNLPGTPALAEILLAHLSGFTKEK